MCCNIASFSYAYSCIALQLDDLGADPSRAAMLLDLALSDGHSLSLANVPLADLKEVRDSIF